MQYCRQPPDIPRTTTHLNYLVNSIANKMETKTVGNGIYALSSTLVFAYTFVVIKYAKPGESTTIFDKEWLEHGFCVINQDIPYMNSHDLCLYVDTVLVALGLLMHHKLKGKIDHQAMKSSQMIYYCSICLVI